MELTFSKVALWVAQHQEKTLWSAIESDREAIREEVRKEVTEEFQEVHLAFNGDSIPEHKPWTKLYIRRPPKTRPMNHGELLEKAKRCGILGDSVLGWHFDSESIREALSRAGIPTETTDE